MALGEEFAEMSLKITLQAAQATFDFIVDMIKKLAHISEQDLQGKQSLKSLVQQGKTLDVLSIDNVEDAKTLDKAFKSKGINYSVEKDKETGVTKFYFQEKDAFLVSEAKEYVIQQYLSKEIKLNKETFDNIQSSLEKSKEITLTQAQAREVNIILSEVLESDRFAVKANDKDPSLIDIAFYGKDLNDIQKALKKADKKLSNSQTAEFKAIIEKAEKDVLEWQKENAKDSKSKGKEHNLSSPKTSSPQM